MVMIIYILAGCVLCTIGMFLTLLSVELILEMYWEYKDRRDIK